MGLTVEQTEKRPAFLLGAVMILPEPPGLFDQWHRFVLGHRVQGAKVHDARLVAVMSLCGVESLLTLNSSDFLRYRDLKVLVPGTVALPTWKPEG